VHLSSGPVTVLLACREGKRATTVVYSGRGPVVVVMILIKKTYWMVVPLLPIMKLIQEAFHEDGLAVNR
jgi:hypothetical protein